jgi:hypothetical protein
MLTILMLSVVAPSWQPETDLFCFLAGLRRRQHERRPVGPLQRVDVALLQPTFKNFFSAIDAQS